MRNNYKIKILPLQSKLPQGQSCLVQDPQMLNRYCYVINNPIMYVDMYGYQHLLPLPLACRMVADCIKKYCYEDFDLGWKIADKRKDHNKECDNKAEKWYKDCHFRSLYGYRPNWEETGYWQCQADEYQQLFPDY